MTEARPAPATTAGAAAAPTNPVGAQLETRNVTIDVEPSETSPLLRQPNDGDDAANDDNDEAAAAENDSDVADSPHAGLPPAKFLITAAPARFWLIFGTVLVNVFIGAFDGTIMASSHPVITSDFHAANEASWLSTAFLLASTAFQPLLGRLSDAVGRKPLFVLCSLLFLAATLWCALAGSIQSFILARTLCGLGAGGSMTLGSIITSDVVPIERRGSYQALINIIVGVGGALGAALGGAMAESLGWRWEFGVQLPFLAFSTIIALFAIPSDLGIQPENKNASLVSSLKDFDAAGSFLLTLAITFLILGLNLGGNVLSWSHPFVIVSLVIFVLAAPLFIYVERRATKPVMPMAILGRAPRANLVYSNFLAAVLSNALLFNIPLYFQAVLLSSATESGLRLVVPSVVASVFGAMTGFAITWTRRLKWPVVSGAALYLVGAASLSLLRRDLSEAVYMIILIPMAAGQGFQFPGTFMAILGASQQAEQAVITTTLILWRSMGLVLGVAFSSLLVQNALLHYLRQFVHAPNKDEIIALVRGSVDVIAKLDEPVREQVIQSYEATMRVNFLTCTAIAAVSLILLLPVKLPRLPKRRN